MSPKSEITADDFECLLAWLGPDKELGARKYETIRERLVKIFSLNGCLSADELADETIDRVCRKARTLSGTFAGDPALYFYGVARKVVLESRRKPRFVELPVNLASSEAEPEHGPEFSCLDECLAKLSEDDRELITGYYTGEKRVKIENRQKLASALRISTDNLRVRALRLRNTIQKCLQSCLQGASR